MKYSLIVLYCIYTVPSAAVILYNEKQKEKEAEKERNWSGGKKKESRGDERRKEGMKQEKGK